MSYKNTELEKVIDEVCETIARICKKEDPQGSPREITLCVRRQDLHRAMARVQKHLYDLALANGGKKYLVPIERFQNAPTKLYATCVILNKVLKTGMLVNVVVKPSILNSKLSDKNHFIFLGPN